MRKTQITFESEELISFKARRSVTEFCPFCRMVVPMWPAEAAAALAGLSERQIFRLIEAGHLHFVEAERVFVCRNSLEICTGS